ncbi:hypothetical protein BV898_10507 [Hypsibius exemplaris]|uniref:Uncharacterized protein n=1 Tax=Hypsibius exemplaris TaxID=2072580 RepID=A0A1W0WJ87_HYPEX|nr:hypothetical protein BV898_10507 [Hypsibius exemplaris]
MYTGNTTTTSAYLKHFGNRSTRFPRKSLDSKAASARTLPLSASRERERPNSSQLQEGLSNRLLSDITPLQYHSPHWRSCVDFLPDPGGHSRQPLRRLLLKTRSTPSDCECGHIRARGAAGHGRIKDELQFLHRSLHGPIFATAMSMMLASSSQRWFHLKSAPSFRTDRFPQMPTCDFRGLYDGHRSSRRSERSRVEKKRQGIVFVKAGAILPAPESGHEEVHQMARLLANFSSASDGGLSQFSMISRSSGAVHHTGTNGSSMSVCFELSVCRRLFEARQENLQSKVLHEVVVGLPGSSLRLGRRDRVPAQ